MAKKRKYSKVTVNIDGVTHYKTIAYYTLDEFADKKAKLVEELQKKAQKTFSDVSAEWEEYHYQTIQTYTQVCYKAPLKDLQNEFGGFIFKEITSINFQLFLERMAAQNYAKQTIRLRKIVMKQIFDYAMLKGYVTFNPITVCKIPKKAPTGKRTLPSDEDINIIKNNLDGMWGLYCNLLLYTGLRREEALALTYEDIDFKNDVIQISKALIFENGKSYIRDSLKSEAGKRTIPLLKPLKNVLDKNGSGYLFSIRKGEPLVKWEFDKGFKAFREKTKLSCTSHQLRHYFATLCFDAELDEKDVQDIMGHSKISLTKEVYTHIREERREKTTKKLNHFLNEA